MDQQRTLLLAWQQTSGVNWAVRIPSVRVVPRDQRVERPRIELRMCVFFIQSYQIVNQELGD